MKINKTIAFVGGRRIPAGEELTADEVKALKASGTKYKEVKKAKSKASKDAE